MALPYLLLLMLVSSLTLFNIADCQLTEDYYGNTCPDFLKIVQEIITVKQMSNPTTAAGTLRLFFHDCMVGGCDASLMIASNSFNKAERDADINQSLSEDAFEVIVRAKTALELKCPGIVSCSDILAVATRDLITMVGGPFYKVGLGRKDSFTASQAAEVEGHIARANISLTEIISIFARKGFNIREMVALSGAHTIGFSHCSEFSHRLFNFSKNSRTDPSMNPLYAAGLKALCANYLLDKAIAAFNDAITPGKFDNMYYMNLQKGIGLLASDQALASDPRTKPFVDLYAKNQVAFFEDFGRAMEKASVYGVKTGNQGDVRRRCDSPNKSPGQ